MIGKIIGLGTAARHVGDAVGSVAEIFVGNRSERDTHDHERYLKAVGQFGEEFSRPGLGWFDQLVNGMNRLPRPMMAVGTLGLFTYAMVDPAGFSERMQGLAYVPEPLWWLLGAIVSFYFGARELHHYRGRKLELPAPPAPRAFADAATGGPAAVESAPSRAGVQPASSASAAAAAHFRPEAAPRPKARAPQPTPNAPAKAGAAPEAAKARVQVAVDASDPDFNAAFEEWRQANA